MWIQEVNVILWPLTQDYRIMTVLSNYDSRSIVRLWNTGFSCSPTCFRDAMAWPVYYSNLVMFTTRGHLMTPLFRGLCLCIKYFGIVNVKMSYAFGFMIWALWPLDLLIIILHKRKRKRKYVQTVQVKWPIWPQFHMWEKPVKFFFSGTNGRETWYLALSIPVLLNYHHYLYDDPGFTLTFYGRVKYGKMRITELRNYRQAKSSKAPLFQSGAIITGRCFSIGVTILR